MGEKSQTEQEHDMMTPAVRHIESDREMEKGRGKGYITSRRKNKNKNRET
jgi:hypothetical protein